MTSSTDKNTRPVSEPSREYTPNVTEEGNSPAKTLTVKEMDADQQPREKAEKHGIGSLSVNELLAIVLRTGTVGHPITEITRKLMRSHNNSLRELERCSRSEFLAIPGIGPTKAIQLEAIMELIRRYDLEELPEKRTIRTSSDGAAEMRHILTNLGHEEIWVILLSRSNQVQYKFRASQGGITSSVFDVKMIMKEALLRGASGLILCHNHPSGNLRPSPEDDNITRRCATACRSMDISMLDHLIIAGNDYYSYRDNDRMP